MRNRVFGEQTTNYERKLVSLDPYKIYKGQDSSPDGVDKS